MASMTQNSPKAWQSKPKTCNDQGQNKLKQRVKIMRHARPSKRCYTTPITTKHDMA